MNVASCLVKDQARVCSPGSLESPSPNSSHPNPGRGQPPRKSKSNAATHCHPTDHPFPTIEEADEEGIMTAASILVFKKQFLLDGWASSATICPHVGPHTVSTPGTSLETSKLYVRRSRYHGVVKCVIALDIVWKANNNQ
jgi:hypothetical protein